VSVVIVTIDSLGLQCRLSVQ